MRKFIRIIFCGLIDSFCLNLVKLSDIAIKQNTLATQILAHDVTRNAPTIPQFLVAKVSGALPKAHPNMLKMLVIRQHPFNPKLLHYGH